MKTYQCHKRVKAAQIISFGQDGDHPVIHLDDGAFASLPKTTTYAAVIGDYLVEYDDSYRSISPKKAFEDGYTEIAPLTGPRFRKKPVVIEAVRWDGVTVFAQAWPEWLRRAVELGDSDGPTKAARREQVGAMWIEYPSICEHEPPVVFKIRTLEGVMSASPGDWIVRGVKGELYACKPDIFEQTYEEAVISDQAQPMNIAVRHDTGQPPMSFGDALDALKAGKRIARAGWNGKGMWLCLCEFQQDTISFPEFGINDPHKKLPWIGMKTADNGFVPWLASQTDMLADDWTVVNEEKTP